MWYALQTTVICFIAYVYLTEVSDQKDIFHALFLGVLVAYFVTVILSGVLNATRRFIRVCKTMLLGRPRLGAHEKSHKLIHVSGSRSTGTPRLVCQIRLNGPAPDDT